MGFLGYGLFSYAVVQGFGATFWLAKSLQYQISIDITGVLSTFPHILIFRLRTHDAAVSLVV